MLRKIIITLLLASLLITHAAATEYVADLTLKQIQGSDSKSWVTLSTRTLNPGGTWDVGSDGSLIIKYTEKAPNANQITFSFSGTSISTPFSWAFDKGHTECIRGTCNDNATNSSSNAVRLTLTDIRESTTSFNTNNSNIVNGYVLVSGKSSPIALIKDDAPIVDVMKIRQETGVTYTKTTSEVIVRFEYGRPIGITVKAESREPKQTEWGSNYIKYTIDSSGTYTFTVKYKTTNPSGFEEETTETYGLKLINLGDAIGTNGGVTKYQSTVYLPDTLTVNMGVAGNFTQQGGVGITALSSSEYRLAFDTAGTYSLKYTTTGGTAVDSAVVVVVRPPAPALQAQVTPAVVTPIKGNQQQGGEGEGWDIWTVGLGIVFVVMVGLVIYGLRRNKPRTMHIRNNPD